MRSFAELYKALDQTTKTNDKIHALSRFFEEAEDNDKLWAIALFSHRRPKRTVPTRSLREWAAEHAKIPQWLFEESYHVVGDLAETIALILPPAERTSTKTLTAWIAYIRDLKEGTDAEKKQAILWAWDQLGATERFLFNKLITGGFRIGVSQKTVVKALAQVVDQAENVIAHRLMGQWSPDDHDFESLLIRRSIEDDISKPYPFYLAYALAENAADLGPINEWQVEKKWDGIRGQCIKRRGQVFVWSRGEELVTDKYPEFEAFKAMKADNFVIDGEILPYRDGQALSFQALQRRIGRKRVGKKLLEEVPVILMVYDLLEFEGADIRDEALHQRRKRLEKLMAQEAPSVPWKLSEALRPPSWEALSEMRGHARKNGIEGFMIKRRTSAYQTGRKRGDWWKWKADPMTIDAVLIYAMRGHGRRSNLYTDFTFGVWKDDQLVAFAKAYSGLTDEEFREITRFVQKHTIERFGPVRSVKAELVFEIAFDGIARSKRHKSGIALRFPRMKRWRKDKKAKEANTLNDVLALLEEAS